MRAKYILGGLFFILLASVSGVLIAIWVFKHFNIYIPLENQSVSIDLQEPLQAKVQIQDALDVSKNITTPTATTLRTVGYTIAPFIFEFILFSFS